MKNTATSNSKINHKTIDDNTSTTDIGEKFKELVAIMAQLRNPTGGCPWDLEQNHNSITPYLIEEAYEVIESIRSNDDLELAIELGDLLLQVVFHAQIANERKAFSISDVITHISEKLVRRHPHVFGDVEVENSDEVLRNWENIKLDEQSNSKSHKEHLSTLSGVPSSMPALLRAQRLGEKAAKVAFDWENMQGVWQKVCEEFDELHHEIPKCDIERNDWPTNQKSDDKKECSKEFVHELGDVMFSLCQLARWMGVSAEETLHKGCLRFSKRFEQMEKLASPNKLMDLSPKEIDNLWNKAKKTA